MINVDQLTKYYDTLVAVDKISFQVDKGEILGFLGPNGAGKSTTMKMLTGFITPTSGTARIGGFDIIDDSLAVREMVGYLPESAPSYKNMTVREFLNFIAEVRGFKENQKHESLDRVVDLTSLGDVIHQTIDTLSKGYRQRVGFAQALIHDPQVLILDEPTDGLDPNQKFEVRKLIKNMAKEKAIILSTHILEEMEAVCDRAIIINNGQLVANGSPSTLLKTSSTYNVVTLTLDKEPESSLLEAIESLSCVEKTTQQEVLSGANNYLLGVYPVDKKSIINEIQQFITEKNLAVVEVHQEKGKMDEVFRNLTVGGASQ